jgi:ribose transport system permease protein
LSSDYADDAVDKALERSDFFKRARGSLGPLIALILICAVMAFLSKSFLTAGNWLNILQQVSMVSIIAAGMTFVILMGGIDLSVGSIVAFTGLITAALMKYYNIDPWQAVALGIASGAFLGFLNGIMVAYMALPPFIATLGMMSIARGGAFTITNGDTIFSLPDPFLIISERIGRIPIPAIIMLITFLVCGYVLNFTRLGRYTYAIGGNETASLLSGINVMRCKTAIFTISGLCCAISAMLLTSRLDSATPVAAEGIELDAIAAVVIGGTSMMGGEGRISGTIIGVLIMGVVNNGMNLLFIPQGPQKIVKGAIIVIAVMVDIIRKSRQGNN